MVFIVLCVALLWGNVIGAPAHSALQRGLPQSAPPDADLINYINVLRAALNSLSVSSQINQLPEMTSLGDLSPQQPQQQQGAAQFMVLPSASGYQDIDQQFGLKAVEKSGISQNNEQSSPAMTSAIQSTSLSNDVSSLSGVFVVNADSPLSVLSNSVTPFVAIVGGSDISTQQHQQGVGQVQQQQSLSSSSTTSEDNTAAKSPVLSVRTVSGYPHSSAATRSAVEAAGHVLVLPQSRASLSDGTSYLPAISAVPNDPRVSQYHTQDPLGGYSYGYRHSLGSKSESHDPLVGATIGSYSYTDGGGAQQTVQYVADDAGFHVTGTNLPVQPQPGDQQPATSATQAAASSNDHVVMLGENMTTT